MLVVATGIVAGALIGLPPLTSAARDRLSCPLACCSADSSAVAALGEARSVRPRPGPTLWIFSPSARGLLAVVGLNAGPDFVRAEDDWSELVLAGALTITIRAGRRVVAVGLQLPSGRAARVCAGACTATPALRIQESARSAVPRWATVCVRRWQRVPGHLGTVIVALLPERRRGVQMMHGTLDWIVGTCAHTGARDLPSRSRWASSSTGRSSPLSLGTSTATLLAAVAIGSSASRCPASVDVLPAVPVRRR